MDGTTKQSALGSQRSRVECVPEVPVEDRCEPREEEGLDGGPVDFTAEGPAALRKPTARGSALHAHVGRSILYLGRRNNGFQGRQLGLLIWEVCAAS
jgi:hypothetical protein